MQREIRTYRDGMLSALGGTDSGRSPSLLAPNNLAFAVNTSLRGGFPSTRPRLSNWPLVFNDTEARDWFEENPLQGVGIYYPIGNPTLMIASAGGRIFAIEPDNDFKVFEITPTKKTNTNGAFVVPAVDATVSVTVDDGTMIFPDYPVFIRGKVYMVTAKTGNVLTARNNNDTPTDTVPDDSEVLYLDANIPSEPIAWMTQADKYFIIQNGIDRAIIFDGASSRRSVVEEQEVPTGTATVFNEEIGRLCVATNGNMIAIGDVVGGPTSVLKFTENTYLHEGGEFRIPIGFGKIVAMKMSANLNRANGQGPMAVFSERGITSFNLPPNRSTWKGLAYPVQINMPLKSATSQAGAVLVNGDIFYRSKDGLRSLAYTLREFSAHSNTPLSSEMERVLRYDDDALLKYASGMLFDNRLLFTVNPTPGSNGVYHRAIGSLDFDLISRMGEQARPVYDGVWTGILPTAMVTGTFAEKERAFIFAVDPDSKENKLWELHKEAGFDNTDSRVQSIIETKSLDFRTPLEAKRLDELEIWVDQVVGQVNFTLLYRPDSYPCWFTYGEKEIEVAYEDCTDDSVTCKAIITFNEGYRTRLGFGTPPTADETLDNKPARIGYEFQFRLVWVGQCRIRRILAKAGGIEEPLTTVE